MGLYRRDRQKPGVQPATVGEDGYVGIVVVLDPAEASRDRRPTLGVQLDAVAVGESPAGMP
jgi:hypothetical protein